MDVSIIIVNYNACQMIIDCINSIFKYTEGVSFEIIVIDNASTDNSRKYFQNEKRIVYKYLSENVGFGRANNEGYKISKGKYIFCLNPDTILINNAVKILSDYLDLNSRVGVCGGNLYQVGMMPSLSYRRVFPSIFFEFSSLLMHIPEYFFFGKNSRHNYTSKPLPVSYITGADLMIRKELIEQYGFYHPSFFMYYEDTELCFRLKKNGVNIVSVPQAKIFHLEGKTFNNLERKARLTFQGRDLFYQLCYNPIYSFFSDIIYGIAIICRLLVLNFKKQSNIVYWRVMLQSLLLKYKTKFSRL